MYIWEMMYICELIDNYKYKTIIIMDKKVIKLTEQDLHNMVKNAISDMLNEKAYSNRGPLNEMARINKKETGKCIFPFNKWEVKIWSNDHNPPHFHIMCNGWNVSYCIEDGSLLEVLSKGKESGDYDYMQANVEKWLSTKCFAQPKLTNRENAILQWEQLYED